MRAKAAPLMRGRRRGGSGSKDRLRQRENACLRVVRCVVTCGRWYRADDSVRHDDAQRDAYTRV